METTEQSLSRLILAINAHLMSPGPIISNTDVLVQVIKLAGDALGQTEHYVTFDHGDWAISHPFSCRPNLLACPMTGLVGKDVDMFGCAHETGMYIVREVPDPDILVEYVPLGVTC